MGATRPRFSGRELLLPLVAGEVDPSSTVMEPQGTAAAVAERGKKLALLPASGAADPHTRMLVLRESVTLLYYPLWLVDYQVADRAYRIVVDANDGTVNSGTAPAANERLNPLLALKVVALVVVAVLAAWVGLDLDRRPCAGYLPSGYSVYSCVPAGAQIPFGREGGIPRALFELI